MHDPVLVFQKIDTFPVSKSILVVALHQTRTIGSFKVLHFLRLYNLNVKKLIDLNDESDL